MIYKYRLRAKERKRAIAKERNFRYAMRKVFEGLARQGLSLFTQQPVLPQLVNRDFTCQNTKSE